MRVFALFPVLFLLCIPGPAGLRAAEFVDGPVKLILHEDTGRFSLYHMNDDTTEKFEPLFTAQDPRTSFTGVILNDRSYRLGESPSFRFRLGDEGMHPSLVFQSSFLRATEEFSFIKTAGSSLTNGIRIRITLENTGPREISLGLRFLLDTSLGERDGIPFLTDRRSIESETLIGPGDEDGWWITRKGPVSLMGSIAAGVDRGPDQVHFANWKRLNEVPWKTGYSAGRNFNYLPYSIGDAAVCYYYEPRLLARGEVLTYTILLAAEDPRGFTARPDTAGAPALSPPETVPLPDAHPPAAGAGRDADIALLRDLINRVDRFVAGEISITEEDLAVMETTIARLKAR
ncbi:MAG: hypothetical protein LBP23_09780, partial [Treponema sp.]|nr:hypothetical protein [Treponema sp.]